MKKLGANSKTALSSFSQAPENYSWMLVFVVFLAVSACTAPPGAVSPEKPQRAVGPQVQAPVYKDGDWWKVNVTRNSSVEHCLDDYEEYLVKIEDGQQKAFGLEKGKPESVDCPRVIGYVLLSPKSKRWESLRFPMRVGLSWSKRFYYEYTGGGASGTWLDVDYEVQSWEKVKTPKGVFDSIKIVSTAHFNTPVERTYYYAPKAKAIVKFHMKGSRGEERTTLVDFKVSQ